MLNALFYEGSCPQVLEIAAIYHVASASEYIAYMIFLYHIAVGGSAASSPNRAPGDLKVSWKWQSSMRYSHAMIEQRECKQVLAQVNSLHASA
ncbi:hypothetical protein BDW71DRAFT_193269 [Aspergillus fruticulosus]